MSRPTLPALGHRSWRVGQGVALVGLASLLLGLVTIPDAAARLFWYGFIPLVPAVLLVGPGLWRNVCPLATLNVFTGRRWRRRPLSSGAVRRAGALGMVLLLALIPARKLGLETNASALLALLAVMVLGAVLAGVVLDTKAGFCNGICPVLPVERLYGQRPWIKPANPRCPTCTVCTRGGCLDLDPTKSVAQTLGPSRKTRAWVFEPFGMFALAFPGVILAYFTLPEVALGSPVGVYAHVAVGALAGYGAGLLAVFGLGWSSELAIGVFGALAFTLYYWLGAPGIAAELAWAPQAALLIRAAAAVLVAAWLVRFLKLVRT